MGSSDTFFAICWICATFIICTFIANLAMYNVATYKIEQSYTKQMEKKSS